MKIAQLMICSCIPWITLLWYCLLPGTAQANLTHPQQTLLPEDIEHIVEQLYQENNYSPLWLTEKGIKPQARVIVDVLTNSYQEGLNPEDYLLSVILQHWNHYDTKGRAYLDLLLTKGLARYIADIQGGRINPCMLDPELFAAARHPGTSTLTLLKYSVGAQDLAGYLKNLLPSHKDYILLKETLKKYREIAATTPWGVIPDGATLRPGMIDRRVPLIIKRLHATGDLASTGFSGQRYDGAAVAGVQHFQTRFGLKPDGIIGSKTLKAMNRPVEELTRQILINMERWRWLPHHLLGRQILVNIAGYKLRVLEGEQTALEMPVIVGQIYHKTPIFSDEMQHIVINPYWNIPLSIATYETLPNQIDDPNYLTDNQIKVFEGWDHNSEPIEPEAIDWASLGEGIRKYRFRQEPGPQNALGRFKFIFPNKHSVYLHDTSAHYLFNSNSRAFSHGCIRVSEPAKLAHYLLKDNLKPWDEAAIADQLESGERKVVLLNDPVPVHILYRTVDVDHETKEVFFYPDIYGRDAQLLSSFFTSENHSICLYPPIK